MYDTAWHCDMRLVRNKDAQKHWTRTFDIWKKSDRWWSGREYPRECLWNYLGFYNAYEWFESSLLRLEWVVSIGQACRFIQQKPELSAGVLRSWEIDLTCLTIPVSFCPAGYTISSLSRNLFLILTQRRNGRQLRGAKTTKHIPLFKI